MSRIENATATQLPRFPRVSGDEPGPARVRGRGRSFSPRERG